MLINKPLLPNTPYSRFDFRRVDRSERRFFRVGTTNWEPNFFHDIEVIELRQEYDGFRTVMHLGYPRVWNGVRGISWGRVHDSFSVPMTQGEHDLLFHKYMYHPGFNPIPLGEDLLIAIRKGISSPEPWRDQRPHEITQEGSTLFSVLKDVPEQWHGPAALPRPWGD